jgi:hypothetical protein
MEILVCRARRLGCVFASLLAAFTCRRVRRRVTSPAMSVTVRSAAAQPSRCLRHSPIAGAC